MKAPPTPFAPCVYCGKVTNIFQFVSGQVCSKEHMEKINEQRKIARAIATIVSA